MPNQEPDIDGCSPVEAGQPLAERRPLPVEDGSECFERHALDPSHHLGEGVLVVRTRGGEREAAVAAENRGDAVLHGRARGRIPEQLRVVVRVQVNKPWRYRLPFGINGFRYQLVDIADCDDPSVAYTDVTVTCGCAGAVDDRRVADQ